MEFIETENRTVVSGAGGRHEWGVIHLFIYLFLRGSCLMSTEFQFHMIENSSGDWFSIVNVLHTADLYT